MSRFAPGNRVLVRLPSWLGDFVMAEPVVRAIHDRLLAEGRPEDLTLVARKPFFELIAGRFEGVRRCALPESPDDWRGHDLALFLNGSWRSPWTALLAGIPARVGWTSSVSVAPTCGPCSQSSPRLPSFRCAVRRICDA